MRCMLHKPNMMFAPVPQPEPKQPVSARPRTIVGYIRNDHVFPDKTKHTDIFTLCKRILHKAHRRMFGVVAHMLVVLSLRCQNAAVPTCWWNMSPHSLSFNLDRATSKPSVSERDPRENRATCNVQRESHRHQRTHTEMNTDDDDAAAAVLSGKR